MKNNRNYMYSFIIFLLIILAVFISCEGTPGTKEKTGLDAAIPVDPDITKGTLSNGLTYYIRHNSNPENRAEFRLAVKAGSVLEDEDQKGLAHFLEHMAFNGTEDFQKHEIINFLESLGMRFGPELNAFTSFDETIYLLQIPTEDTEVLETGLHILCQWAHAMLIEEEEVDKERGVIIEEWRRGRGADARIRDKQFPVLFEGSRYAERMPIGDIDVIKKADAALIRRFYQDWYRPDLMAIVAVGDFDKDWMEERIKERFSRITMPENPRHVPEITIPGHEGIRYAIATDPEKTLSQVRLFVKYPYEYEGTIGEYRDNMNKNLFSTMLNQRLDEISKKPDAPFITAYTGNAGIIDSVQLFVIGSDVKEGKIRESLDVLLTEVERVRRYGFTESELIREKKNIMAWIEHAYKERDTAESSDFAAEYIRNFLTGESIPGIVYEYTLYDTYLPGIGLDEINSLSGEHFTYDNSVVMVSGPEKEEIVMPDKKELAGIFDIVKTKDIDPYTDTVTDKPLITETLEQKEIVSESENSDLGTITLTLQNGIIVVLKKTDFKTNEILFTAFSPGGTSLAEDDEYIPAVTAVPIIERAGLDGFTLNQLQKKLAGVNVEITPWIHELYEGMSGKTIPGDLEIFFQLIYLYFTSPRKDPEAFQTYKEQWKTELENKSASPEAVFWDTVRYVLSQENERKRPYTLDTLDKMDLDASYKFYKERFKDAGDFTFFFVGDFDVQAIRPLIQTYLANLPSTGRTENWKDTGIDPPDGVLVKTVKKGLEPKSQVLIVFADETEWSPDRSTEMSALTEILNIRLREIIREEEGGTYDIWAYGNLQRDPDEEYIMYIGFGCAPEKVDPLITMVQEVIEKLIEEGPTETELEKVQEILKREYETNIQENNYWLQVLQTYAMYNMDPERILTFPARIKNLSSGAIQRAASEYMNFSDYTRFILLPEEGEGG